MKESDKMKYALITGASSGIGEEFAKRLAKENYHLILVARRRDRLETIKDQLPCECDIICADLSLKEECLRVVDVVKDLPIEVLINNAGFGDCSYFLDGQLDKELQMIDVNIQAMHILTKEILKIMVKNDRGYLLNVASSAGLIPAGPYMATYYATKAYVTSFTQAIAQELKEKGSHVYIGALCPGPVATEFNQVAEVEFALKGISAQYCVDYALKKMKKKKVLIIPTWTMKFSIFMIRFIPRSLYIRIVSHQQKRKIQG